MSDYGYDNINQLTTATSRDSVKRKLHLRRKRQPHHPRLLDRTSTTASAPTAPTRTTTTPRATASAAPKSQRARSPTTTGTTATAWSASSTAPPPPAPPRRPSSTPTTRQPLDHQQVDPDGDGPQPADTTHYDYDGNQIVLEFERVQFASPTATSGAPPSTRSWPTSKQAAKSSGPSPTTSAPSATCLDSDGNVANHIVYDAFGNVISETDAAVDHLFGYTGRPLDEATDLQNNLNRWYDAGIGQWPSEDPIGFAAGDANLFRYVGNTPTVNVDPTGYLSWRRSVSISNAFRIGVGEGTLSIGQMIWNDARPAAGEMAALVTMELYHFGGVATETLTGGYATLPGHEAAWQTALNIADNSAFISQSRDFIDVFNRMTPSQRLGFVASIPGSMYGGLVDWFSDLYSKIGKGCYEDAARQLGNAMGQEALERSAASREQKQVPRPPRKPWTSLPIWPRTNASRKRSATCSKKT